MADHSIDSLLRMQGRSFRPVSIPPSTPCNLCLRVSLFTPLSFSFFDSLSPYKYTLPYPFDLFSSSFRHIHPSVHPTLPCVTNRPPLSIFLSFYRTSYNPLSSLDLTRRLLLLPTGGISPSHLCPGETEILFPFAISVSLQRNMNAGGRGRKGMTRRTGLSDPHPRNDKTPVEG